MGRNVPAMTVDQAIPGIQEIPPAGGDFSVAVRVRPPLRRELVAPGYCHVVSINGPQLTLSEVVCATLPPSSGTSSLPEPNFTRGPEPHDRHHQILANHVFTFDTVDMLSIHSTAGACSYNEDSTQPEVYERTARKAVRSVLQGYNATILAYGQTGTGKTHTMEGFVTDYYHDSQRGIIPRSMAEIFEYTSCHDTSSTFVIRASYLQIYNETISDLLPAADATATLSIRQDRRRGVYVDGLTEYVVREPEEVYTLIRQGNASRAIATTKLNDASSRSHAVFVILVEMCDENGTVKVGKLNLVDLAGSERVRLTGATGIRLEESKKINQSLSALGNVIAALTEASRAEAMASGSGRSHIPYRDSKLTRLLEDSLGGNCITAMVAMISPAAEAFGESLSTLKFANRAKSIRNTPVLNEYVSDQEALIRKYEAELQRLRSELAQKSSVSVSDRQLQMVEEGRRQAEQDQAKTYRQLQYASREFAREKQSNEALTERVRQLQSQLQHPALNDGNQEYLGQLRQAGEALEREREALETDKLQLDRYKTLLVKQRDIMLALTTRLDDRDQTVLRLQRLGEDQEKEARRLRERIAELEAGERQNCRTGRTAPYRSPNADALMDRIMHRIGQIISPETIRDQLQQDILALHRELCPDNHPLDYGPPECTPFINKKHCVTTRNPDTLFSLELPSDVATPRSFTISGHQSCVGILF
ncbi:hypothetical protein FOZ61_003475 [Perkinsus olseni]|uniref:Kinesin-like protein n=1 Tax=Perkinsus olseni TaxID=32597 RepID=A0A7J6LPE1_PEROL|nr:hypothetical protein FOZ61_003475 [Perkinsus olseni]